MSASSTAQPVALQGPFGRPEAGTGPQLAKRAIQRVACAQVTANVLGALDVALLLWLVLPTPHERGPLDSEILVANAVAFAVYLPLSIVVGSIWGNKFDRPLKRWLEEDRPPTERERSYVLHHPTLCLGIDAALWAAAAALFTGINFSYSSDLGWHVGVTILMGGLTTCAVSYLLTERLLRPITAHALASGPPPKPVGPGVKGRLLLAWACATGVPLIGLVWMAVDVLVEGGVSADRVAVGVIVLAGGALMVGLIATVLVAKSVAEPLTSVRKALRRIEAGDLDTQVRVTDGSEVGLLQTGFNRMAAGLREREQLRELFGRHVGEDVARAALERGGALGGEVRDVAVLFVDVVGSTTLAARRPPEEVVALLNRFFAVVVEVTGRHGGWVNKFEGDAALVVFGCPAPHDDCAGAALAAARELRDRLALAVPGVRVGIGVSAGPCVAGNVGAEQRYEYTVIGDPVNEAARLSDLAKHRPERVLASAAVLERTREKRGWRLGDRVELRGRAEPTRLAVPA